ncbi:protein serine phosphatase [Nocardiopsis sp. TSRI0078]|uniref:PP2C family protein-serine/threonine phosphatase n=1 Tax=unclassified Nocardiopsis TaxID=2649073 RepID=UPI00093E9CEE|nr:PP2C family protein-serine/threonine phosphatase [Nocardiopsis sp. TSRI0078]OKI15005.1 protein serine phosphatase [Nocardiopsis sp. TSRI0078]
MREPLLDLSCHGMVDVALARVAMARVLDPACVSDEAELEFLDSASSRVLREVEEAGEAALVVELAEDGLALRATVRDGSGANLWSSTLGLSEPLTEAGEGAGALSPDPELLSAELLRTSGRAGAVAAVSGERARDLEWHQHELEETNLGVLALHAELAEASDEQRRLLAAERSARDEAEASRNRLTFLSTASARLMTSLNQSEIFSRLRDLLVPRYADSVQVWLLGEDGRLCSSDADEDDPPEAVLRAAARKRSADALAERGHLALPLLTGTDLLGVMLLRREAAVDSDDEVVLVEFSHRVAVSLDNARRFERERDTAAALQRAMLTDIPRTPGMELTARYLPATRGMNVGGDWYDVFPLGDGEFIGVVGDVTGHGIHAAVTMGQLRTALRAYALEERSPAALMERLDRVLGHLEPDLFATAVIVRFRPGDPEMVMAGAGHPPPLWRDGEGRARAVELPSGGMLGLPVEQSYTDHTIELPPGAALLLYTDGLVERRGESIDDGIARLLEGFGGPPYWESGPEGAADALLDSMVKQQDCDDDVCLLVLLAGEAPNPAG